MASRARPTASTSSADEIAQRVQGASGMEEISELRLAAVKEAQKQALAMKTSEYSTRYGLLKIVIWKNLTIRKRRKTQFLLLLAQIFLWFGIACFSLATRGGRMDYVSDPAPGLTPLVQRLLVADLTYPVGVAYNQSLGSSAGVSTTLGGHDGNLGLPLVKSILRDWVHYYRKTYKGLSPPLRLFKDRESLVAGLKDDRRISYGIYFEAFSPNHTKYTLFFWENEIPVTDEFSGYDCRKMAEESWGAGVCQMTQYGKSGFLTAQTALNTALMMQQRRGGKGARSGVDVKRLGPQEVGKEQEEKVPAPKLETEQEDAEKEQEESQSESEQQENASEPTSEAEQTDPESESQSPESSFLQVHEPDIFAPTRFRLELPELSVVAERYPEHAAVRSQASESAGSAPFYFMFPLVSVFSFVVMDMVMEKESKMKEIMKTYGLSSGMFWLSWFVTYCYLNVAIVWVAIFIIKIAGVFGPVTSLFVLILLMYMYLLSLITLSFVVSIFFHKAQTATLAGMVFNLVLYALGWMIYHTKIANPFLRIVFMLFSTVTFSLSICDLIAMLPDRGVALPDLFNFSEHDVGLHLIMLCVDTLLYFALAWYLDEVVERDWGSTKHWTFVFGYVTKRIKRFLRPGEEVKEEERALLKGISADLKEGAGDDWVEPVSSEVKKKGIAVKIRGLVKRFPGKEGEKTVVDQLNLDMYCGEVFGLLGHNGAGKTTTISMLTGMLQIDDGDAWITGYSVKREEKARKLISVCPQQNTFFEDLTCLEHLVFFSALRGIDVTLGLQQTQDRPFFDDLIVQKRFLMEQRGKIVDVITNLGGETLDVHRTGIVEMEKHFQRFGLSLFTDPAVNYVHHGGRSVIAADSWEGVLAAIEKVGLSEKMFSMPRMLSGGMKRRFWLVIALLGDPKVLFLDEPTSGVDPLGRQELWRLIQDEKIAGRCVVITTHHMEEADILADRKGIMTAGKLRCVGTSLFLKSKFGIGYYLEIEVEASASLQTQGHEILQFIQQFVPEAQRHTDDSKGAAQAMAAARKNLLLFSLPLSAIEQFSPLLGQLEAQKKRLHVARYGVSLSTLEEVFFRLGEVEEDEERLQEEAAEKEEPIAEHRSIEDLGTRRQSSVVPFEPIVQPTGRRASLKKTSDLITPVVEPPAEVLRRGVPGDLVSQKFRPATEISFWKHLWAVVALRNTQIYHNKMNFFVDVLFPCFTLVVSLFFREGQGGLDFMATRPDNLFYMNDYSRINQTIVATIDPRLSPIASNHAYKIVENLPSSIKELIQLVDVSYKDKEKKADELLIKAGLAKNQSTPQGVPARQEILETDAHGLLIRNYLWHKRDNKIFKKPEEFSAGLSFEPRKEIPRKKDSKYSVDNLQIRIFWNAGIAHSLPIMLSAITDAHGTFLLSRSSTSSSDQINSKMSENSALNKKLDGPSIKPSSSKIDVASFPLMVIQPIFVTAMTYGMYVMLSLGLSSLPARFGIQIMLDKFVGTKHAMIVMGLSFNIYWIGSFLSNYAAMIFGNLVVCFFIAYFIPLFWSFAIVPVIVCAFFYSASVLLWAYFLSQLFYNLKAYAMSLQILSMLLCLCPAYIVSVFSDAAMAGAKWGYSMLISHIVFSLLFPAYNPIGVLIGCAVVASEAHFAGIEATLPLYFDPRKMPVWSIIAAFVQGAILFLLTVWLDRRLYHGKTCPHGATKMLEMIYQRRNERRQQWLDRRGGNQLLIPGSLQDHKDDDVLAEEFECMKIHKVLTGQEQLYKKYKSEEKRRELSEDFQMVAQEDPGFPEELPLILIDDLHYLFEGRTSQEMPYIAVRGFSLSIYRSEIFGLLGPNGAGKTTSINLLTCNYMISAPTKGNAFLGGHDVTENPSAAFSHLGLCPQFDALWQDCTVRDNLRVFARIKNIPEAELDNVTDRYINDLELEQHQNKRISECSGGNKRRVSVAVAFMGESEVVLMDEPSSGIDPIGRRRLAELIHRSSGDRCVLITTHSMEEAEALCSRIGIIVNGELNCLNTSLAIRNRYGAGVHLEVIFDETNPNYVGFDPSGLTLNPWQQFILTHFSDEAIEVGRVANRLSYDIPLGSDSLHRLFAAMEQNKSQFAIVEYGLSQPTLEQVFIGFAKRQKSAQESAQEIFR